MHLSMLSRWGGGGGGRPGIGGEFDVTSLPVAGLLIIPGVFLTNNNNPGVRNLHSFDPG